MKRMPDHLADTLLIAAIDDELTEEQAFAVDRHLAECEQCRSKLQGLRGLSADVEDVVRSVPAVIAGEQLAALDSKLRQAENKVVARPVTAKRLSRLGWGAAVAASIAMAVYFAPQMRDGSLKASKPVVSAAPSGTVEVDGETFISLPYSNPDLPANSPHIVEMEVSVASLADAGIMFEPVANEISEGRDSVLADVLFGVDGQPLGVHVLGVE